MYTKAEHNDPYTNRTQIQSENRETKLPYIQHQHHQSLKKMYQKENLTYGINMTDKKLENTVEYIIFEKA